MKNLIILGCSGSIGRQAIDVVRNLKGTDFEYCIKGLSVNSNIEVVEKFAYEFFPEFIAVANKKAANVLKEKLRDENIRIFSGTEGILEMCQLCEYDLCINGIVGIAGLLPTIEVLKKGINVALANKETLVAAGKIVMDLSRKMGAEIIPLDSEHSAIFQCLQGEKVANLSKLILTASGGPFLGMNKSDLKNIKKEQALKHPNWVMGSKITIDSATLMNKGLEVIEAVHLFDLPEDRVDVVVHPESIIHSMIELKDFSILAQMGNPDMKIPIQYGMTYPERVCCEVKPLKLYEISKLTFFEPDNKTFKALSLARNAIRIGGTAPVILNSANEVAVELFLQDKIGFLDIASKVEEILNDNEIISNPSLEIIIETDSKIRQSFSKFI